MFRPMANNQQLNYIMQLQNPFDSEENLQPWFELNSCYNYSFRHGWNQNFKSDNPFIFSIQNILTYFTKHALVTSLLLLLSLGSIGAVAAELTLPEEYKPSTVVKNLFAANTQPDTDPYTRLVYDGDNDVVSLDRCNLAVKYPKLSGTEKIQSSSQQYVNTFNTGDRLIDPFYNNLKASLAIGSKYDYSGSILTDLQRTVSPIGIECFSRPYSNPTDFTDQNKLIYEYCLSLPYNVYPASIDNQPQFEVLTTNLSNEQLREKYGWFVTQSTLTNIVEVKSTIQVPIYTEVIFNWQDEYDFSSYSAKLVEPRQTVSLTYHQISFEYNDNWYVVRFSSNNPYTKVTGLLANQVQMQFNSIVTNEANVILQNPDQAKAKFQNIDQFEISVNPACNIIPNTSYFLNNYFATTASVLSSIQPEDQKYLSLFQQFLDKSLPLTSDDGFLFFDLNDTQNILRNNCSGMYIYYLDDLDITIPNTDRSRVVYTFTGQGPMPTLQLFGYGKKDMILY
jgi:hypothetical protein